MGHGASYAIREGGVVRVPRGGLPRRRAARRGSGPACIRWLAVLLLLVATAHAAEVLPVPTEPRDLPSLELLWERPMAESFGKPYVATLDADTVFVVGVQHVAALAAEDGALRWETALPASPGADLPLGPELPALVVDGDFAAALAHGREPTPARVGAPPLTPGTCSPAAGS